MCTKTNTMATHNLKILPEHFKNVIEGTKRFEVRRNDRNFKNGDGLCLEEYDLQTKQYTGQSKYFIVTNILYGGQYGIQEGFCVMSIY